jgi:hypothetical protein
MPRRLLPLLLALLLLAVTAPGAGALVPRQVFGIGNVGPDPQATFADPALKALHPRATRLIADWNVARTPGPERDRVDAWVHAALRARLKPLLSFQGFKSRRRAPTVHQYQLAVRAAVRRWPQVREWQAWNEANHPTQPATYRHPRRAARYALALEAECWTCTVLPVTLQLSRSQSTRRWVAAWLAEYGHAPRIWALHGYSDANRATYDRLSWFMRTYRHGRVWITETGALAKFAQTFPYDLRRQRRATRYVFGAATRFRHRVDRLYWWQWRGASRPRHVRWDSGLLDARGRPRPAYRVALAQRFAR